MTDAASIVDALNALTDVVESGVVAIGFMMMIHALLNR